MNICPLRKCHIYLLSLGGERKPDATSPEEVRNHTNGSPHPVKIIDNFTLRVPLLIGLLWRAHPCRVVVVYVWSQNIQYWIRALGSCQSIVLQPRPSMRIAAANHRDVASARKLDPALVYALSLERSLTSVYIVQVQPCQVSICSLPFDLLLTITNNNVLPSPPHRRPPLP